MLGHRPRDAGLFARALTHGSLGGSLGGSHVAGSHPAGGDYQRLEFLGDRVLGLTIAAELFARYPAADEGELASRFNALVAGETCALIARRLGLPDLVQLGPQAISDGTRTSTNLAADVMEAVIGALFLDGGIEPARAFVLRQWAPLLSGQVAAPKHPKAALQEWASAAGRRVPHYDLISRSGPDHAPKFTVAVSIGKIGPVTADGTSKQAAETHAATAMVAQLIEQGLMK